MPNTLSGLPLVDPQHLLQECLDRDLPTDWYGRASVARFRPGREPGTATVLMARQDVYALDPQDDQTLEFDDLNGGSIKLKRLTILHSESVISGPVGDGAATHIVTLVDRRHHFKRSPFSRAYNVTTDGTTYRSDSKNGGALWTWQQMLDDLWGRLPSAGTSPMLPFTPHGTPANFAFYGSPSAWAAYNDVLDRLACAAVLDPTIDKFSIVRMGDTDTPTERFERSAQANDLMWDTDPFRFDRAERPEKLVISFQRFPQPTDGSDPTYSITKTLPTTKGVIAGTALQLQDDAPAVGSSGAPSNVSYLTARADERTSDYLRKLKGFDRDLNRSYLGIWPEAGKAQGKTYAGVAWQDRGAGFRTELLAEPATGQLDWKGSCNGGLLASLSNSALLGICAETVVDAYGGSVTTIKRIVERPDKARVCLAIKPCCPSRWYCVDNRWLVGATSPCCPPNLTLGIPDGFKATRIIRVAFKNKTGYAADEECGLPEGIFFISEDGLAWGGGGTFQMGATLFSGGLTIACVSGTLKATWGVSNFSGGSPITIPCLLTGTEISLGTFNVDLKICKPCDPTIDAPPSTVEVWISSALDANSDPETPLEVKAGWIPPYQTTGGPFEKKEQADECCVSYVIQECGETDPSCTYRFPTSLTLRFYNGTGCLAGASGTLSMPYRASLFPAESGWALGTPAGAYTPVFTVPGTSKQMSWGAVGYLCDTFYSPYGSSGHLVFYMYNGNDIFSFSNGEIIGTTNYLVPGRGIPLRCSEAGGPFRYTFDVTGSCFTGVSVPGSCKVDVWL